MSLYYLSSMQSRSNNYVRRNVHSPAVFLVATRTHFIGIYLYISVTHTDNYTQDKHIFWFVNLVMITMHELLNASLVFDIISKSTYRFVEMDTWS